MRINWVNCVRERAATLLCHRVNWHAHWKLMTFMIGGNDFCSDICYQTNATQWLNVDQEANLLKTLRYMRDNMPRYVVVVTAVVFEYYLYVAIVIVNEPPHNLSHI